MAKIYVSSTFVDLQEYREQVRIALRSVGHEDVAMEYYTAGEERPVDKCLKDVAACDIYVGIFAWRYGYIPKGQKTSVTEQEYRTAVKLGKPCLIFILKEDAPWPVNRVEVKQINKINKLRKELAGEHLAGMFSDKNDLAKQVTASIYNWALKHGHIPISVSTIPAFDLDAYYTALRKRYGVLALEGLTPPQKEEYLQIQLRQVFVEQSARENPPPVELPKEVWEKLSHDQEIHSEDLPSGLTLDDARKARESYYEKPARPVLEALTDARQRYTIILGDPGSGKSTLARYVMLSLIEPTGDEKLRRAFDGCLPLLVELRSYAGLCADDKCKSFLEFLEYLGQTEGWALTQAALHNHLKNDGRAVVIFDGLDEIFDPGQREQVARQIAGFCNDYPTARVIVTSRILGYRRKILTDAGFTHFTLQDLDEKQVETFVTRWYDLAMSDRPDEAKERRERILKSFQDSASIRQLAGNPMLLTIMAIIGKHQELPRERWKLYDHAASVLIQHWDVNKHLKDESIQADFIGEDDKKELLRRLAFHMQGGDGGLAGNYIHHDELQTEFENYLKERYNQPPDRAKVIAGAMIQQFRERNFILSLYGANVYGFVHRAFLEFFCASAFVWKFEKTKELTIEQLKTEVYGRHWEDQDWHEVLRLICGMVDGKWAGEIIEYLTDKVFEGWRSQMANRIPWNVALALHCLGEVRNISTIPNSANKVFGAVLSVIELEMSKKVTMSHHLVGEHMKFVGETIGQGIDAVSSQWQAEGELLKWLNQLKPLDFSAIYAETFGKLVGKIAGGQQKVYEILMRYLASKNHAYRVLVPYALAIGWHDDAQTALLLRKCAVNDENEYVRGVALDAIVKCYREAPETLHLLRERAVKDENGYVHLAAVSGLVRYYRDDSQTLPLLRERVVNDEHEYVRMIVVFALAEYYRDDPQALPLLRERVLKDESPKPNDKKESWQKYVRQTAMDAIAKYWPTDPDTLPLLRERAQNDPTPWLRERAQELIAKLESEKK